VKFTPLPYLIGESPGEPEAKEAAEAEAKAEARRVARQMVKEICADAEAERDRRNGKSLGVEKILATDPHSRPAKLKRSPAPDFHTVRRDVLIEMRVEYREFVEDHERAAERLSECAKKTNVCEFPRSCFPSPLPYVTRAKGISFREILRLSLNKRSESEPDEQLPKIVIRE